MDWLCGWLPDPYAALVKTEQERKAERARQLPPDPTAALAGLALLTPADTLDFYWSEMFGSLVAGGNGGFWPKEGEDGWGQLDPDYIEKLKSWARSRNVAMQQLDYNAYHPRRARRTGAAGLMAGNGFINSSEVWGSVTPSVAQPQTQQEAFEIDGAVMMSELMARWHQPQPKSKR